MKPSLLPALAAVSISACAFVSGTARSQTVTADPIAPVGVLTAFPTIVQTGTKPKLTWSVIHPSRIGSGQTGAGSSADGSENMAIVNPPGTIIPTQDCFVTVQIIGPALPAARAATPPPRPLTCV